jgi:hypothetical protein
MYGKPSCTAEAVVEVQLDEFIDLARQVISIIDSLSRPARAALDAAGWHSGHIFGLRAELGRAAECADAAKGVVRRAQSLT